MNIFRKFLEPLAGLLALLLLLAVTAGDSVRQRAAVLLRVLLLLPVVAAVAACGLDHNHWHLLSEKVCEAFWAGSLAGIYVVASRWRQDRRLARGRMWLLVRTTWKEAVATGLLAGSALVLVRVVAAN